MILNSHNTYGGYFELELQTKPLYHANAIALNSGRNCLEYLIISRGIQTLYLPYYTCEVLLEPCKKHNVNVKFYNIDEYLEIKTMPNLNANEYLLYTNYFGIKDKYIGTLENQHLIIDNSQSFYSLPIKGVDTFILHVSFLACLMVVIYIQNAQMMSPWKLQNQPTVFRICYQELKKEQKPVIRFLKQTMLH